jgi:iron complex outermembrane receptor protein
VIGHPYIEPERATEVDVWGQAVYPRWRVQGNVYGRLMSDFLFLYASGLKNRLPISPGAVYRYLNGEGRYYGFEVEGAYALREPLVVDVSTSYLYGGVRRHSEPVFGVPPASVALGLRYEAPGGRFFARGQAYLAASQERVELLSNEARTDGYVTLDVRAGGWVRRDVMLLAGINNVLDAAYAYHLNARDAFTEDQLMEPGRNVFATARFTF